MTTAQKADSGSAVAEQQNGSCNRALMDIGATVHSVVVVAGDLGFPLPQIGINRLLAHFERGGMPRAAVRGLRDLASTDLDRFVQFIATRDGLCAWARGFADDGALPRRGTRRRDLGTAFIQLGRACHELVLMAVRDRAAFRAVVRSSDSVRTFFRARHIDGFTSWPVAADWRARPMIGEYTEAIRRLGKFGEVSLTIASEDPTFSPYYTLGRDQPLYLQVQLEVIGAPTTVHVKLFSSGLISASIVVLASTVGTTSEQNAASIERLKWLIARILPGAVNIEHLYPAA